MPVVPMHLRTGAGHKGTGRVGIGGGSAPDVSSDLNKLSRGINKTANVLTHLVEKDRDLERRREMMNLELDADNDKAAYLQRLEPGGDLHDVGEKEFAKSLDGFKKTLGKRFENSQYLESEDTELLKKRAESLTANRANTVFYHYRNQRRKQEAAGRIDELINLAEPLEAKKARFDKLKATYGESFTKSRWGQGWQMVADNHEKVMAGSQEQSFYKMVADDPEGAEAWLMEKNDKGEFVNGSHLSHSKRYALRNVAQGQADELERRAEHEWQRQQHGNLVALETDLLSGEMTEGQLRGKLQLMELDDEKRNTGLKMIRSYFKPTKPNETKEVMRRAENALENEALGVVVNGGGYAEMNGLLERVVDLQHDGKISRTGADRVKRVLRADRERMKVVDEFVKARMDESWSRLEWGGSGFIDNDDVTDDEFEKQIAPQLYRYAILAKKEPTVEELKTLTVDLLEKASGEKVFGKLMNEYIKDDEYMKSRQMEREFTPGEGNDDELINSIFGNL